MCPPRVAILLASCQGARYIREQLDSLERQEQTNWRLIVSDDGSTDGTVGVVRDFAAAHPGRDVSVVEGPRRGATQNFLHLVGLVEKGEALAYCDQDDVWRPDRLSRGISALAGTDARGTTSGPMLHASRTTICDLQMSPLRPAPLYTRPPGFLNALVQACTPGNTTLVSPAGVELLQQARAAAIAAGVVAHDWWTYQVISGAGGNVIRDPALTVLYRQHPGNVMGRNDTTRARFARLMQLGGGDFGAWLRANGQALRTAGTVLTADNLDRLDRFRAALDAPGPVAALRLASLGVYRQTRGGTAALLAAAAAGRL